MYNYYMFIITFLGLIITINEIQIHINIINKYISILDGVNILITIKAIYQRKNYTQFADFYCQIPILTIICLEYSVSIPVRLIIYFSCVIALKLC